MALVAAIRQAEQLKADLDGPGSALQQRHAPGLVVQIINQTGEVTQTIDAQPVTPMIEHVPIRNDLDGL